MKAQMEIMGLAIIVILVTLGIFFMVSFQMGDDDESIGAVYRDSQLSANLLNSLLQMNAVNCSNKQIKSLLRDCALNERITCSQGRKSCEFLDDTLEIVLNETLNEWNRDFYFNASKTHIAFGTPCPLDVDVDLKQYPIQAEDRTVIVSLEICGIS